MTNNSKISEKNRPWMGLVVLVFFSTAIACLGYLVWIVGR